MKKPKRRLKFKIKNKKPKIIRLNIKTKPSKAERKALKEKAKQDSLKKKMQSYIHLGTLSAPNVAILFDSETQHFKFFSITKRGKIAKLQNTYSASFLKEMLDIMQKAEEYITTGYDIAPEEEEE